MRTDEIIMLLIVAAGALVLSNFLYDLTDKNGRAAHRRIDKEDKEKDRKFGQH